MACECLGMARTRLEPHAEQTGWRTFAMTGNGASCRGCFQRAGPFIICARVAAVIWGRADPLEQCADGAG